MSRNKRRKKEPKVQKLSYSSEFRQDPELNRYTTRNNPVADDYPVTEWDRQMPSIRPRYRPAAIFILLFGGFMVGLFIFLTFRDFFEGLWQMFQSLLAPF